VEEAGNGADDEGVVLAALDGVHALGLALLPATTNALLLKLRMHAALSFSQLLIFFFASTLP
jgi:hypothetical protein